MHASREFDVAMGLFGLLGDAHVQIIEEVSDQVRLNSRLGRELREERQGKDSSEFPQRVCEILQQELNDAVIKRFGPLQQVPANAPSHHVSTLYDVQPLRPGRGRFRQSSREAEDDGEGWNDEEEDEMSSSGETHMVPWETT